MCFSPLLLYWISQQRPLAITTLLSRWLNITGVDFSLQCECSCQCSSVFQALHPVIPLLPRASESSVASLASSWPLQEERKHAVTHGTFHWPGLKVAPSLLLVSQGLELVIWSPLMQGGEKCSQSSCVAKKKMRSKHGLAYANQAESVFQSVQR